MKKIILVILSFVSIMICFMVEVYAGEDTYETYNEIMMVQGKLLRNFTDSELELYYQEVRKPTFWGVNVHTAYKKLEPTYISSTLNNEQKRGNTEADRRWI